MKTLIALAFAGLLLTGCTGTKEIRTVTTPTQIYIQHPAVPDQLNLREVKFKVVNKEKILEMLNDPKYTEDDFVWIVLTPQGYENMSLNMREIKRYIEEQKEIIIFYRDAITDYNKKAE